MAIDVFAEVLRGGGRAGGAEEVVGAVQSGGWGFQGRGVVGGGGEDCLIRMEVKKGGAVDRDLRGERRKILSNTASYTFIRWLAQNQRNPREGEFRDILL